MPSAGSPVTSTTRSQNRHRDVEREGEGRVREGHARQAELGEELLVLDGPLLGEVEEVERVRGRHRVSLRERLRSHGRSEGERITSSRSTDVVASRDKRMVQP